MLDAIAAMLFALVLMVGAVSTAAAKDDGDTPLNVVATTGMIADAARVIGGDAVSVRMLMGPGIDPHAYRPTRTDIVALSRADLVLSHGLFLEAQMEGLLERIGRRGQVVAVAEALPRERLRAHDVYAGKYDPHVWMAPELWRDVVVVVRDALGQAKPSAKALFARNTARYLQQLQDLEAYARKALATVPEKQRILVTAHDAFAYFGATYGFKVHGIQGISTDSEAGLQRIRELVDLIVAANISAVFVESSVPARSVQALVEGARAQGHDVGVGGELFSDAMGSDGTYEGTYIGMMDHNVTTIVRALGGDAPAGGMNGRLVAAKKGN